MNTQDKARFFAAYWGQTVVQSPKLIKGALISVNTWVLWKDERVEESYLELTSLDQITDEHAIEVHRLCGHDSAIRPEYIQAFCNGYFNAAIDNPFGQDMSRAVADSLRSKGYLVPFDKYSCEQLLEMGWTKIREI